MTAEETAEKLADALTLRYRVGIGTVGREWIASTLRAFAEHQSADLVRVAGEAEEFLACVDGLSAADLALRLRATIARLP
jgi:hypothetical protein